MISLDRSILDFKSVAGRRMLDYAELVDAMEIILLSAGGVKKVNKNLIFYPTSFNKIASFIKAFWIGCCVLRKDKHTLITVQDPFGSALLGYLLSRIFHLPLQIQIHTTFLSPFWKESLKNTFYQSLAKFFVTKAVCIRVVSNRIKTSLVNLVNIPEEKIFVLPIFTDVKHIINYQPKFDLHAKYPQFDFIILMASRLVKQKNINLAISAVRELVKKYPNIGLVIVGSGPEEKNLKLESRELQKNIIFEPWSNDLASYYKGADIFLLTSNYEGWGMTIIEAMASGLPVIMTNVGLAGEIIKNGENGIVIPVGNLKILRQEIERLYTASDERERFAKAGQNTVQNLKPHTWNEYLDLYKKSFTKCVKMDRHHD